MDAINSFHSAPTSKTFINGKHSSPRNWFHFLTVRPAIQKTNAPFGFPYISAIAAWNWNQATPLSNTKVFDSRKRVDLAKILRGREPGIKQGFYNESKRGFRDVQARAILSMKIFAKISRIFILNGLIISKLWSVISHLLYIILFVSSFSKNFKMNIFNSIHGK